MYVCMYVCMYVYIYIYIYIYIHTHTHTHIYIRPSYFASVGEKQRSRLMFVVVVDAIRAQSVFGVTAAAPIGIGGGGSGGGAISVFGAAFLAPIARACMRIHLPPFLAF